MAVEAALSQLHPGRIEVYPVVATDRFIVRSFRLDEAGGST
jgi:hypothetical protein